MNVPAQPNDAELQQLRQVMAARLNDERAIIFTNLLNGVPVWQVARDFHKSGERDVLEIFGFILRKIKSYCFERRLPPVMGNSVGEVRAYTMTCLQILPKINLDKEPKFAKIFEEKMELRKDGTLTNTNVLRDLRA